MKPYIAIILLLFTNTSYGQKYADTTLSKKTLDSLLSAHNTLKGAYKKQGYRFRVQMETTKIDTANIGHDSTVISYWTTDGKLLKRVEQFKKDGCVLFETEKFYNALGSLEYRKTESRSCGTPKNTDPEIKVISGFVQEMERFEYDDSGRVILRVWWYYSIGVRKYSYSYNGDNQRDSNMTYISQNEFWL